MSTTTTAHDPHGQGYRTQHLLGNRLMHTGGSFLRYLVLISLGVVFGFPFYWLVTTSLKVNTQLFVVPPVMFPDPINWANYPKLFEYLPFQKFIMNTVIITALTIGGVVFSCPLAAYSFARLRWPLRNLAFMGILATLMLPEQVTLIPQYLLFTYFGWIDTWNPLWVPSWFGSAFYIFLLRQFFMTIPNELEDAAKIDGAGYLMTYRKIMLPLVMPALAAVVVFSFIGSWNNFLGPLIYVNTTDKMPISLALRLFQSLHDAEYGLMMAASTIATLPIVLLFFFAQRYFIQGIVLTGLKG
ncbi:MAG: carbohydrate ABC transporter permease [Anaerolineae bacterium]